MTNDTFNAVTLLDLQKRLAPNGGLDSDVIEVLARSNPIMQDIKWMQGNLPTGIQTTQRSSIPEPGLRRINKGVQHQKSTTKQITDTCCILETRSLVDVEALALIDAGDREAYRRSEDAAFVEGFGVKVARNIFYGEVDGTEETFNGLSVRYPVIGGKMNEDAGYQVVSGGSTTDSINTTAFLVGWGNHHTMGIYPKGSTAGLKMRDLGELDAFDDEKGRYRAVSTLFTYKPGLTVRDIRSNALVRNINAATLANLTSEQGFNLMKKLIIAKNRIRNLQGGSAKYIWYVSRSLYDWIEIYQHDKNNVHVTRQESQGNLPTLFISGIPVQRCDEIMETEALYPTV
jgi:hypothetical protein